MGSEESRGGRGARVSRAERQEQTREALLEAAAATFAERGYHGASIEDITARAGFTRGAFYSNFADKDALFLALMDRRLARRTEGVAGVLRSSNSPESVVDELRSWSGDQRDDWWLPLSAEFRTHALRNEAVRAELAVRQRAMREDYARAIQAQFDAAGIESPVPVEDLAVIVQVLDHGLPLERAIDPTGVRDGFLFDALGLLFRATAALAAPPREP